MVLGSDPRQKWHPSPIRSCIAGSAYALYTYSSFHLQKMHNFRMNPPKLLFSPATSWPPRHHLNDVTHTHPACTHSALSSRHPPHMTLVLPSSRHPLHIILMSPFSRLLPHITRVALLTSLLCHPPCHPPHIALVLPSSRYPPPITLVLPSSRLLPHITLESPSSHITLMSQSSRHPPHITVV